MIVMLLIFLVVPTPKFWLTYAESTRIGPISFDSSLEDHGFSIGSTPNQTSANLRVSFDFQIKSRPEQYSVLFSTTTDLDRGMHITQDKYGNVFMQVESDVDQSGQIMLVAAPFEVDTWHRIDIEIAEGTSHVMAYFDNHFVTQNEARNGHEFVLSHSVLRTTAVTIGGIQGRTFHGTIKDLKFQASESNPKVEVGTLKLLCLIILMWLVGQCLMTRLNH